MTVSENDALVSLIIPTFNYGHFVGEALESALAQTWPRTEVIVVDDGSTDDTPGVVAPYRTGITFVQQDHAGVAAARNAGIRASRGDFVAYVDADDTLPPDRVARQVACFETSASSVGMVFTNARLYADGDVSRPLGLAYATPPPLDNVYARLLSHNFIFSATAMFRRSALERIGMYDDGLPTGEDYDFFLRLSRQFDVAYLDAPLYCCRIHAGSLMHRSSPGEQGNTLRRILEKQFMDLTFPPALRSLRRPALANTHREVARQYLSLGQTGAAVRELLSAALLDPLALASPRRLAGYVSALASRSQVPTRTNRR